MNCADALDRMLEADPPALRGDDAADAALAGHLRACDRCRRVADTLSAELGRLDAGLEELAMAATATGATRGRSRSGARGWLPLAAAASVAALLLLGRGGGPPPEETRTGVAAGTVPAARSGVAVALPADRGAAVLSTTNPKITVVWLYERSER